MLTYLKHLSIISLFLFTKLVFAQEHEIETQQKNESTIAATHMTAQGTIIQDKHNRVYLKIYDNYTRKFYSIVYAHINPHERRCLRQNHLDSTNKIFLYQAKQPLTFTQQIYDITIKGIYKNTYFQRWHGDIIKKSTYSVRLKAPELAQTLQSHHDKYSHKNQLNVIIASSKQSIKTKKCY